MAPGTNLGAATPVRLGTPDKPAESPGAGRRTHGAQAGQRRRRLYPWPRATARAQRRVGRARGARGGQPGGARGRGAEGDRPAGPRPARPAAPARRPQPARRRARADPGYRRRHGRAPGTGLARAVAGGAHRSQRGADPDDDRHLRADLRTGQSRHGAARRTRRHLPAARPVRPADAAGQLRRAGADRAGPGVHGGRGVRRQLRRARHRRNRLVRGRRADPDRYRGARLRHSARPGGGPGVAQRRADRRSAGHGPAYSPASGGKWHRRIGRQPGDGGGGGFRTTLRRLGAAPGRALAGARRAALAVGQPVWVLARKGLLLEVALADEGGG